MAPTAGTALATLNDENTIPLLGLGVYKTPPGPTAYNAVLAALQAGYRHVDTAAFYHNEADVGRAVAESGLPREERLGMWRALVDLRAAGRVRSIGVSNYGTHHIDEIVADGGVLPAVNQVEVHPFLLREKLAAYCEDKGILIQAYSPLAKASKLRDPTLLRVAAKHGKSVAQVMIRFSLQKGYITLPKSQHPQRIAENAQVFDFELLPEDMRELNALDTRLPTGWDPTKLR
eukprot:jgi/Tetstr1/425161/TSEL_015622.t1